VRGLTTAAGVWVTAAVGTAAGAGLTLIAALATGVYLIVVLLFPQLTRRLPRSATAISVIRLYYPDGHGILRDVLQLATTRGFAIDELSTATTGNGRSAGNGRPYANEPDSHTEEHRMVEVTLQVHDRGQVNELAAGLSEIPGVRAVVAGDVHAADE